MKFLRRIFWRTLEWPIALFGFALASFMRSTSRTATVGALLEGAAVFVNGHRDHCS